MNHAICHLPSFLPQGMLSSRLLHPIRQPSANHTRHTRSADAYTRVISNTSDRCPQVDRSHTWSWNMWPPPTPTHIILPVLARPAGSGTNGYRYGSCSCTPQLYDSIIHNGFWILNSSHVFVMLKHWIRSSVTFSRT